MLSTSPLFSIIIPTYNRANLIGKSIESVLAQEFKDFELIIVDDGSKDLTEEVINQFIDPRIRYFKKENGERGAARNYGSVRARGSYINFFDSDDSLYPHHLQIAEKLISVHDKPVFFHLAYDQRLPDGTLVGVSNNFSDSTHDIIMFNNVLSCNGVFIRRDIAVQFPFEEDRILASSEDWELWIRISSRFKLIVSNEVTSSVLQHESRSLYTIPVDKVVARDLLFIEKLKKDQTVMQRYGPSFHRFIAERYSFFMLCFAEQKRPHEVIKWAILACQVHPLILFSKRFLASLKNMILK